MPKDLKGSCERIRKRRCFRGTFTPHHDNLAAANDVERREVPRYDNAINFSSRCFDLNRPLAREAPKRGYQKLWPCGQEELISGVYWCAARHNLSNAGVDLEYAERFQHSRRTIEAVPRATAEAHEVPASFSQPLQDDL
jgi:hypothetical protein